MISHQPRDVVDNLLAIHHDDSPAIGWCRVVGQEVGLDLGGCAAITSYNRGPSAEEDLEQCRRPRHSDVSRVCDA